MKCFSLRPEGDIKKGVWAVPLKTEDERVLWNIVVCDQEDLNVALGPGFTADENPGRFFGKEEGVVWVQELKGRGALLLVILRSLNDGQIWKPNFSHQAKKPWAKVSSPIDGLPLAELWHLEKGEVLQGEDRLIEFTKDEVCFQVALSYRGNR